MSDPAEFSFPLGNTYGVWLVSFFLETVLYGMGLLQMYLYFFWYPNDGWRIKGIVIALTIFETLQIVLFFRSTYDYLILNFGNYPALLIVNWSDAGQIAAGYCSAFIVQTYFGWCIYSFDKSRRKVIPFVVWGLALCAIGTGLAQSVIATLLGSFSKLSSTVPITTAQSACTFVCDVVITISLCYYLQDKKTGLSTGRTNRLLNFLMIVIINRGALTALAAATNLVLFIALPGTFYFSLGLTTGSKLYMNSMLATLNARKHAQSHLEHESDLMSVSLQNVHRSMQHNRRISAIISLSQGQPATNSSQSGSDLSSDNNKKNPAAHLDSAVDASGSWATRKSSSIPMFKKTTAGTSIMTDDL